MRIPLLSWLFFMPICLLSISFYVPMVCGKCLTNQKALLLQLKNTLIFDSASSTKLVHWNKSIDCCSWEGVTCNKGCVIGLDLSYDSISCPLDNSSSLFKLRYLQNLNLAGNDFNSSEIPSEFSKLSNLVCLNLSNAGFQGQIPITISHLKGLVRLDLSADGYYGDDFLLKLENPNVTMLVQNLSKLTELYLDGVDISMQGYEWGPTLSFSLPNLRVLSLSNCNLSGPFDPSLANLESLSVIDMSYNELSAPIPDFFADFRNLTNLIFSGSSLNGKFPERIFQIPTLQMVDLSDNDQLEGFLPEFPSNGSLQTLVLSRAFFSRSLPYSIGNLKLLSEVDLSFCNFSGEIPKSMANLTKLFHLDLSMNRFIGPIPSLSMSKNLKTINLDNNDLTGQIASTRWVDLLNLETLDLSYNSLEGSIPVSLFSLPSLQELHLQNNRFSGQLDEFSTSPHLLSHLDLSHNNLEGQIPISVFKLPSLGQLDLSSNHFNGSWQFSMTQKLKDLTFLDLSYNDLSIEYSGINFSLFSFPQFSTLRLASNKLKRFPDFLQNQSALNILDLSNCQIHGQIPHWIWEFTTLNHLNLSSNYLVTLERPFLNVSFTRVVDLSSNKLQGPLPILPFFVEYLDLSANNFHSSIPTSIINSMVNIHFLSLSSNKLYGNIPKSLCNATGLRVLDLSNNFLSGKVPHCIFEMSETGPVLSEAILGVLNLRKNNLSGKIPDAFQTNCGLQTLDLSENQLEGKFPKSLAKCKYLEFLDIENNNIEDAFPCYLRNISMLRVLVFKSNKFHGPIDCLESNATWPMLQIINLASNNFSGKLTERSFGILKAFMADRDKAELELIHQEFLIFSLEYGFDYQDKLRIIAKGLSLNLVKILTIFTILDLSCNNFNGPLPKEIGNFKSLYVLNLSHNVFTGNIPKLLGKLSNLESLDLSGNELTGDIPVELADGLIFLSFLNLSFNQLSGKIPQIKQFATFPKSSYKGNIGLCGFPLEEQCTGEGPGSSTPPSEEFDSNSGIEIDWNFLSVELGFVFGFGIAIGPLMFWKRWRMCYYKHADEIFFKIFPRLYITIENHQRQARMNHRRRAHRNQGRRHE
ncbi:receptor-like protein 7 [Juglans microcarpa x Juglans regia]|uniref:receptor-like protein 7 n=1 Tax=Juglans microcarpa x Juglans regia TaxID=2249226 RepID=UPI001B7E5FFB|nr:receptor-like protein 7 [Juglans microcarpa x Juglans regia]XP_041020173.1 receptor-like protein 7 [Juglans microcarpa x Juglans regia]XP_041020174.1 receptor-like protein 7 [Juglans microcarpa x Juglans regia]XP_041020175.1 receptor-like protein 7 [Juglans microcarpa x Juglans regia]